MVALSTFALTALKAAVKIDVGRQKQGNVFKEMIMEKGILVGVAVLLITGGMAQAQTQDLTLHGAVDVTYLSKYVWRGFDIYDDKSAIQPSVNLDLFGTGFGVGVMGHRANSSEFENGERWDLNLYYGNRLFEGESYVTNYRLGWVLYNYPDQPTEGNVRVPWVVAPNASVQELHAILSWPEICPAGVIPTYILVKMWPTDSGSFSGSRSKALTAAGIPGFGGTASGFAHIFMLDYSFPIEGLIPEIPEHMINLHSEVVFNDGVGPAGQNVDQDWSNAVFGVSTSIDLQDNLVLTPGVHHQITMDKSVNDDKDETWVTLSAMYKF